MQSDLSLVATTLESTTPPVFEKRIGSTTYKVTVHFSDTSTETIEDKLLRLMQNEVSKSA